MNMTKKAREWTRKYAMESDTPSEEDTHLNEVSYRFSENSFY
jgi:hypothetical protein